MKTKPVVVTVILMLGLMTSCQKENESLRSDAKLIQLLKADVEFQSFFAEAMAQYS